MGGEVQRIEPVKQSMANTCTSTFAASGVLESHKVLPNASLSPSTLKIYKKALAELEAFSLEINKLGYLLPCSVTYIAQFIARLHHRGLAPKTFSTYLSAVGYAHKIRGFDDPTQAFLIRKLVAGAYRLRPAYDMRLPITVTVFNKLVHSLEHTAVNRYDYALFRAMFYSHSKLCPESAR